MNYSSFNHFRVSHFIDSPKLINKCTNESFIVLRRQDLKHPLRGILLQGLQFLVGDDINQKIENFSVVYTRIHVTFLPTHTHTCKVRRFDYKVNAQARYVNSMIKASHAFANSTGVSEDIIFIKENVP